MGDLHKINKEQRLYVIKESSGGYSCLGFDVLDRKARSLAFELGDTWTERKDTKKAYRHYSKLLKTARKKNKETGWRSKTGLSPQLIGLEKRRVEVETTYGEKRRFYVGKSTGWIPCHLEIPRKDSTGGPAADFEYKSVQVLY